ncbi:uncharacterized protein CPUR_08493 [Claviceps purpurea 20.1]|uniref:Uncharacterized protein n=1 Tax=Claviceps purpurea (strain 20.1) TaxID=1111077 RepID=M1WD49_CLAP2|nr:uncharacterized protein CPUR_08493 [Claviceps purpurea 20.1]
MLESLGHTSTGISTCYNARWQTAHTTGKADFLFHLQEIRNRTFKQRAIISAWEKSGLLPHNPLRILDRLQDALSSLTTQVKESNLPGYVEAHEDVDLSATSPFLTKDSLHADVRNEYEYINASDLKAL